VNPTSRLPCDHTVTLTSRLPLRPHLGYPGSSHTWVTQTSHLGYPAITPRPPCEPPGRLSCDGTSMCINTSRLPCSSPYSIFFPRLSLGFLSTIKSGRPASYYVRTIVQVCLSQLGNPVTSIGSKTIDQQSYHTPPPLLDPTNRHEHKMGSFFQNKSSRRPAYAQ